MYEETAAAFEVRACVEYGASGFEQAGALVADGEVGFSVALSVGGYPLLFIYPCLYLVGKVVYVYYNVVYACRCYFACYVLYERFAAYGDESFGKGVGQGFQTRSEPCCEYHCFHIVLGLFVICT